MRLALLSDIHANLQAFEACVAHARAQRAQRFAFLGDMVGYGAHPAEVVERVMRMVQEGGVAIQGNHDAMAVDPPARVKTVGASTASWTHDQLSKEHLSWLRKLPLTLHHKNLLFVHASAHEPESWPYVYDQDAAKVSMDAAMAGWPDVRYVFSGHVHAQTLYYRAGGNNLMLFKPQAGVAIPVPRHRQWLCTVGSVGQPRDGNPAAMYCMMDTQRAQLTYHRVSYDHYAAATSIRHAGLPDFFATRLEEGR